MIELRPNVLIISLGSGSDDARIQTEIVNPEVMPITDIVRRRRFPVIIIWPKPAILHVFSYTSMDGALEELARIAECIRLAPDTTSKPAEVDHFRL